MNLGPITYTYNKLGIPTTRETRRLDKLLRHYQKTCCMLDLECSPANILPGMIPMYFVGGGVHMKMQISRQMASQPRWWLKRYTVPQLLDRMISIETRETKKKK